MEETSVGSSRNAVMTIAVLYSQAKKSKIIRRQSMVSEEVPIQWRLRNRWDRGAVRAEIV